MKLLFFLSLLVMCNTVYAQDKSKDKTKKDEKIIINSDAVKDIIVPKNILRFNKQKKVAIFDNVKTIDNDNVSLVRKDNLVNMNHLENSKIADVINLEEVNIEPASVNGTLTPRNSYLNSNAYLEILGAAVLDPRQNIAKCTCGGASGLTYVNMLFKGEVDQRYMITMDVSPLIESENPNISLWVENNGQIYHFSITKPHDNIDVIIRPDETGMVKLWSQCQRPNDNPMDWIFHSATIRKID